MHSVLFRPVYPHPGGIAFSTIELYKTLQERRHQLLPFPFRNQNRHWLFPRRSDRNPSQVPLIIDGALSRMRALAATIEPSLAMSDV